MSFAVSPCVVGVPGGAIAGVFVPRYETDSTFASTSLQRNETAIAFASAERPFCAISTLQRCRRFQWDAQRGLQRCCRSQSRPVVACCARKSSPCEPKMAEKRCFQACWANYFADDPVEGPRWANFFADRPPEAPCWASYFAEVSAEGLRWANFVARGPRGGMVCTTSFGMTRAMIVERNRRRRACRRAQWASPASA